MKKNKSTFVKLLKRIKKHSFFIILSLIMAAVTVATTLYVPILVGRGIDCIIGVNNVDFAKIVNILIRIGIFVGITALSQWLMNICNNRINLLVHSDIFYTTLFTDHNTDRSKGVYCTDTAFGLVGIINEMLVYSDEHTIELLPAWSDKLGSGMVKGLRTRCGITIDELKWDVDKKKVYVSLDWGNADEINIVCGKYEIEKIGHEVKA